MTSKKGAWIKLCRSKVSCILNLTERNLFPIRFQNLCRILIRSRKNRFKRSKYIHNNLDCKFKITSTGYTPAMYNDSFYQHFIH